MHPPDRVMAGRVMAGIVSQRYVVALGGNAWHHHHGPPRATLTAVLAALTEAELTLVGVAPIVASRPVGPSQRTFANGAVLLETPLDPPAMLARLHAIEARFGRTRRGQPWRARALDLDVVLWSGGCWSDRTLTIPHIHFRDRPFVLGPACAIAPRWRDPLTGLTLRALHARLTRPRPIPKRREH